MTEYTDEELNKLIEEKQQEAKLQQHYADNGVYGFTLALDHLNELVHRGAIPESVLRVMERAYKQFRIDMGLDIPQQPKPKEENPEE